MERDNEKTKLFAILLRRVCDDVADFAGKLYHLADGVTDEENPERDTLPYFLLNDDEKAKTQGCQAVDLGLPSGLKWADRNVGAKSPEAYGDYFMWGSTTPDTDNVCDWAHAPFNDGETAYNYPYFKANSGTWVTENGTLKPDYDAAHAIMGGTWRMPTSAEMMELLDGTTRSVEKMNGLSGMRFTSKSNGNSIFMPFAGGRVGSHVYGVGDYGYAWSMSIGKDGADHSRSLGFGSGGCASVECASVDDHYRCYGFAVRGVHE